MIHVVHLHRHLRQGPHLIHSIRMHLVIVRLDQNIWWGRRLQLVVVILCLLLHPMLPPYQVCMASLDRAYLRHRERRIHQQICSCHPVLKCHRHRLRVLHYSVAPLEVLVVLVQLIVGLARHLQRIHSLLHLCIPTTAPLRL